MAIKIRRNPLSLRPRTKAIQVVADPGDPSQGAARVKVCEIPKGLLDDLRDDIEAGKEELASLNSQLGEARFAWLGGKELAAARERGASPEEQGSIREAAKAAWAPEVRKIKARKGEVKKELFAARRELIRWGIIGHEAEDFPDEESGEHLAFDLEDGEYDGRRYVLASAATLDGYESAGERFLDALFSAIILWQSGEVAAPSQVWEEYASRRARVEKGLKRQLIQRLAEAGYRLEDLSPQERGELEKDGVDLSPLFRAPATLPH